MNALTLTPNSRLARFLLRQYQNIQSNISYSTPQILSIGHWLERCYQDWLLVTSQPLNLLSPNQALFIWEGIIRHDEKNIFQPAQMAQTAIQAYEYLQLSNLAVNDVATFGNIDVATFINWAIKFENYCTEKNLICQAALPSLITTAFSKKQLTTPTNICLASFDDQSPQLLQLLETLKTNGCTITAQDLQVTVQTQRQIALSDTHNEIMSMARWVKKIHGQDPQASITCIIPKLSHLRPQLVKTFQTLFSTENTINISGGYSLAQAPIIKAALQFLRLNIYALTVQDYTALLTSPFIKGYPLELNARALLDSELRDCNEPEISWQFLLNQGARHCEQCTSQFQTYLELRKNLPKQQTMMQWNETFLNLLTAIGWPGDQSLSSEEYQQVQRWYELLQELANLNLETVKISYQKAVNILANYTQRVLFQKETFDGPIQILGLLEAAGLTSDYLWIMGLDSETWPASAAPNPFLPRELQRQYNMPHSSPERELHFSQQLMQRFSHSAKHIIYSWHRHDAERELVGSPLLKDIPIITDNDLQLPFYNSLAEEIFAQRTIEVFIDNKAPVIQPDEKASGGSGIFKDQAACPFRAFAHYRLKATAPNVPEIGLDALERGSLLHSCLDLSWSELKTHATLCQTDKNTLQKIINNSIEVSFKKVFPYSRQFSSKLQPMFKRLEIERLEQLILNWLEFEKQRAPFTVVAHEQWRRVQVGKLSINLQIDRIDELADGQRLLLDYKTGKTNPSEWFGNRPRAPQLPLYAITEKNINALAFAQVRIDDMCFKGVSESELQMSGIKIPAEFAKRYEAPDTWQVLLMEWHHALEKLADDYYQGIATVDPLYANTCDDCDLHMFCRIAERTNYDA